MLVGTVGSGATGAALPFFSVLLSRVTNAFLYGSTDTSEVNSTALYFLLLGIGIMFASFAGIACWTYAGARITTRVKNLYLQSALRQDFEYYDTIGGPGNLLNDLTDESDAILDATGAKVARFIQNLATAITGFIIAFVRGWAMTLVMLSLTPMFIIITFLAAILTQRLKKQDNAAYAVANTISVEALANVRTVHASNAEEEVLTSYQNSLSGPVAVGVKISMVKGGIIGSYLFITYSAYALAIWFGSLQIADGNYNGGTVINVLFAAILGAFSLAAALPNLQILARGQEAAARLYAMIDRKPLISHEGGDKLDIVKGEIQLQNVAFAYPSHPDRLVFKDLNILIEAGTSMALVGESGSGKSTIIGLIERFYDPKEGSILLDGCNVRTLDLRWYRSQVGLVQQEPVLFAGSIADNIKLGSHNATQKTIEDAAIAANIHEFICSLPEGYETVVGEKGTQLSGGQKQRLAIARALLKNPRILLLDEATSALDTKSERVVQKALESIMKGRTSIIIAHRLSTVVKADCISVLQEGVIVESGNHSELMAKGGVYSNLAKSQNLGDDFEESVETFDFLRSMKTISKKRKDRDVNVGVFLSEMSQQSMKTLSRFLTGAASLVLGQQDEKQSTSVSAGATEDTKPEKVGKSPGVFARVLSCFGLGGKSNQSEVEEYDNGDKFEPKSNKSHFQRIASLNAPEWYMALIGVAGAAGMGGLQPAYAYILSKSVNTLYNPDIAAMKSQVQVYSGVFVAIGGGALICALLMFGAFGFMGNKLALRVRLLVFRSILRQEMAWFDRQENSTGVLVSRLASDSRAVKGQFGDSMGFLVQVSIYALNGPALCSVVLCKKNSAYLEYASKLLMVFFLYNVQNATTILVALILAFVTNWNLAIVVVAASPTVVITALVSMELVSKASTRQLGFVTKADGKAAEALYNLRTVAALGVEPDMSQIYQRELEPSVKAGGWHGVVDGAGYGVGQLFVYCMYSLAFWYGGKLVASGSANPNQILEVFLPIFMAAFGAGQAQMYFPDVARGRAAASRVFSIVDRIPTIDNLDEGGIAPLECHGHIEFEMVRFAYPSRPTAPVFKSFSLEIPAHTSMALVGESGSGKSTVVGLLQRFYAPSHGAVLLDGNDLSSLNLKWLRSRIGLVGQEPVLFSMSIRDNIAYGSGNLELEDIMDAAKTAFAADFISTLPQGYDTLLGNGGVSLSGGQKQRLAIARALVKKPQIYLLDEATSALDAESESVVTMALEKVMKGKTSIIVAHKLNTVEHADCISVLRWGEIIEKGSHSQLLEANGVYSQLLAIQQGGKKRNPKPSVIDVEQVVESHPVSGPSSPAD